MPLHPTLSRVNSAKLQSRAMASDRQRAANQRNAKKSTGPSSDSGKRRSRQNAVRHGLAMRIGRDPLLDADVEKMTRIVSVALGEPQITLASRSAAEGEIDLLRISKLRAAIFEKFHKSPKSVQNLTDLGEELRKLHRYERRAFSRRRRALDLAERTQFREVPDAAQN